ncbi:MAG: membrane protein insertion efficiency factor YidD [Acidimicrobiia bacterium]
MFNPFKIEKNKIKLINPFWWILFLVVFLHRTYSRFLPNRCRFYPTCSSYARDCLKNFGATKSLYLIAKRLSKCHPFHPGGIDKIDA